jgi:4a-hydroxytetrahydrobiopterin dehydratase
MSRLSDEQVQRQLAGLDGWERIGNAILKQYTFGGFKEAMAFVNRVATLADEQDHHPDILIEYSQVTLTLSSHDAGGLTERDFRLAARVDA